MTRFHSVIVFVSIPTDWDTAKLLATFRPIGVPEDATVFVHDDEEGTMIGGNKDIHIDWRVPYTPEEEAAADEHERLERERIEREEAPDRQLGF